MELSVFNFACSFKRFQPYIHQGREFSISIISNTKVENMEPNLNSTVRAYYRDTNLLRLETTIANLGIDENGNYVVFHETIFHPQGGGQPDDKGCFEVNGKQLQINKLIAPRNPKEVPYIVKHYFDMSNSVESDIFAGQKVILAIDIDFRKLCARLHSAGHLLSNAVNQLYPEIDGCGGHHFHKQAFVTFAATNTPDVQKMKSDVLALVNSFIQDGLVVQNNWEGETRTIKFGALKEYPCGGTHVTNSSEIGTITIRNVKKEKTGFKIGYDIE